MDEPDRETRPLREAKQDTDQPPPKISLELSDPMGIITHTQLEELSANAASALAQLSNPGEVRVRIVNDEQMSKAHQKFSGIAGTTDVLTFDLSTQHIDTGKESQLSADTPTKILDVDLMICADEAKRQSESRGHALTRELLLYIIHGVLHCVGYDDHDEASYQKMHKREDEILLAIGIGPTFFPNADQSNPTHHSNTQTKGQSL
jgi:rRNA maturation RNase YbeY